MKKNKLIDSLTRDDRPCADADAASLDLTEQLHILCQSTALQLDDGNMNMTKRKKSSVITEFPEKVSITRWVNIMYLLQHPTIGVYGRLHEQIAASARRTDKNRAERDLVETCRTLLNELHAQHMHDDQQWPALDACAVVQLVRFVCDFVEQMCCRYFHSTHLGTTNSRQCTHCACCTPHALYRHVACAQWPICALHSCGPRWAVWCGCTHLPFR
jgi:hypothetical protein